HALLHGRGRTEAVPDPSLGGREQRHRRRREGSEAYADPARLRVRARNQRVNRLGADVRREEEEACGDQLLGTPLGRLELEPPGSEAPDDEAGEALARLSAPKPISAIEEAAIPAPIAIPNSTTCQPIPSQARPRARRTSP